MTILLTVAVLALGTLIGLKIVVDRVLMSQAQRKAS